VSAVSTEFFVPGSNALGQRTLQQIGVRRGGRPTTFVFIRPAVAGFVVSSLQKQIHAVEIDDGVAEVERVHAEDPGDLCVALLQCEVRQRSYAKFFQ
jgi:hypothetical protein